MCRSFQGVFSQTIVESRGKVKKREKASKEIKTSESEQKNKQKRIHCGTPVSLDRFEKLAKLGRIGNEMAATGQERREKRRSYLTSLCLPLFAFFFIRLIQRWSSSSLHPNASKPRKVIRARRSEPLISSVLSLFRGGVRLLDAYESRA